MKPLAHPARAAVLLLLALAAWHPAAAEPLTADILVYGATPAGVAAAVEARRVAPAARVVLVDPGPEVGGAIANGLTNTDFITFESLGGAWSRFMSDVVAHYRETYGPGSRQIVEARRGAHYEPRVAETIFRRWLDEAGVELRLEWPLLAVDAMPGAGGRLTVARAHLAPDSEGRPRASVAARLFIDASYEGDLLALAGGAHVVGREARAAYDEPHAPAEGDWHSMCMNYRITLTSNAENRLPIPPPQGYDRSRYLPALAELAAGRALRLDDLVRGPIRPMPNDKADFNDRKNAPVSLRWCSDTSVWIAGNAGVRERLARDIRRWNQGYLWFLQNDADVPEAIRAEIAPWGMARDEFVASHHWPRLPYVREGRRALGDAVFTEHDGLVDRHGVRAPAHADAVAMGDYNFNSHGVFESAPGALVGSFDIDVRPWQVRYGALLVRNLANMLVPVPVSASHIGYGAIRMEPSWVALGQAAGAAAARALAAGDDPRAIDVAALRRGLHEAGALTFYAADVPPGHPSFRAVQTLGNLGLFQDLVPLAEARPRTEGMELLYPGRAQWRSAFPNHDILPDRRIEAALARRWQQATGVALRPRRGETRGTYLVRLLAAHEATARPTQEQVSRP